MIDVVAYLLFVLVLIGVIRYMMAGVELEPSMRPPPSSRLHHRLECVILRPVEPRTTGASSNIRKPLNAQNARELFPQIGALPFLNRPSSRKRAKAAQRFSM